MLRKLGAVVAIVVSACAFLTPTASAQITIRPAGVGGDMSCAPGAQRIKTADGYALQISQESPNQGKVVQHWIWGGAEQKWLVCKTGGSDPSAQYTFWNVHTRNCLGAYGADQGEGAYFTETECVAGSHQRFSRFIDPPTGLFLLQVSHSGKFMNMLNNSNGPNTIMAQYTGMAKLFSFAPA